MGSPGSTNGKHGEYVRIPEEVEVASKGEGDAAVAVKAATMVDFPRVLRCHAIRWWAKVAVLGIVLARAGAAAVVFLGPLLIKKVIRREVEKHFDGNELPDGGSVQADEVVAYPVKRKVVISKAVDEDLYKVPQPPMYQKPRKMTKVVWSMWIGCLGFDCIA